uniref:ubiquinol-cytochrome-c reductase complex assembly factor 1-like isoform X2 n=1 Tax=Erigeron canadensis TaxID=72917 RepID=UPI001CB941D7|nr:ubiquinol-cytochrome-c reductase complex assembly factor 1-like isoform X2 [Erigeron canadensis]
MMIPGWRRILAQNIRRARTLTYHNKNINNRVYVFSCPDITRPVASVEVPINPDSTIYTYAAKSEGQDLEQLVSLNKMFRTKATSLALPPGSPHRVYEPSYKGICRFILTLMLFYSEQSTSIRAANVIYLRVVSQVDKPSVYDVLRLEKTFRTTFSMLVVHMWLCLQRLKAEGKEGVELGQYVYEIYNHDLEMRVSKAGVNLLLSKWMRELEKVFYGNIVAYDTAMLPEAKPDELQNTIWKNVFSDDGSPTFDAAALPAVLAFTRYVRRECTCLSLTGAVHAIFLQV